MTVLSLVLCSKGDKHILVCTMNHAGLDALNAFVIYNSFLTYIGLLSAGTPYLHTPTFAALSAQCTTLLDALHCPAASDALPALLSGCHLQTCPPRGIFALCLLPTKCILRSLTDQSSHKLPPLTLSASEMPCAHDKTFLHMPCYTYVDICDVVVQASPCRSPSPTPLLTCWAPFPLHSRRSTSWRCAVALAWTC